MTRSDPTVAGPPRRVALAAGGSAGHVRVALAIAEALRAAWPEVELRLLGAAGELEERLAAAAGLPLLPLPAAPFRRQGVSGKVASVLAVRRARRAAVAALRGFAPQLVVGTGAYASLPAVLAARALGARVVLHEANARLGLANRLLLPFAAAVLVGELWAGGHRGRVRTGTPVAQSVRAVRRTDAASRERAARLLVTSGAEGSAFLHVAGPGLAAAVGTRLRGRALEVRHQAGGGDIAALARRYATLGVEARVTRYLEPVAESYAWADLALSAAGASTLAERAACVLPGLVVPVDGVAGDHQRANARRFAAISGMPWQAAAEWSEQAAAAGLAALLSDAAVRRSCVERLAAAAVGDCGERVVAACARTLRRRPGSVREEGAR
jgi:UDP-N-acetylglucosamine--N-acetylmuramyl-(pentapeptide) pyrophosphoryl-undecaprenol N-acetylglucosamine transferase